MVRVLARGVLLVVLGLLPMGAALAQDTASTAENPHLAAARTHIENGELDEARRALDEAIHWPRNSNAMLAESYQLLAVVLYYADDAEGAFVAFERLLGLEPRYVLPERTAAPIAAVFERVKAAYAAGDLVPVHVAHDPVGEVAAGATPRVSATITGMRDTFVARVHVRGPGESAYRPVALKALPGNQYVGSLSPVFIEEGQPDQRLDYYLEVTDPEGRRVQGQGSALEPLGYTVKASAVIGPNKPRWYANPLIWIGVGAVVAGTITIAAVASGGNKTGELPVRITVQ